MAYPSELAGLVEILRIGSIFLYFAIVGLCLLIGLIFLKISRTKWENRTDIYLFFVSLFFITLGIGYIFRINVWKINARNIK